MLVVGIVSSPEEQYEVRVIAEIWLIGERIRSLARQQPVHTYKKKEIKRGRSSPASSKKNT